MKQFLLLILISWLFGISSNSSFAQKKTDDALFLEHSNRILKKLNDFNYFELLNYISKEKGLRFSPYAHVDTINDVQLSRKDIEDLIKSKKSIHWGSYDGSGDSINLSIAKYHVRYVYDVDFLNAEKVKVDQFIGTGNSLNNLMEAYPHCRFVEYHFSGFNEKYDGMDWKTIRLVFNKKKGKYYLVGIIHDQWTI